jgi:periplasmic protein TonB
MIRLPERKRQERWQWAISAVTVLLVHAGFIACLLVRLPMPSPTRVPPMAAIMIELASTPTASPITPAEIPPGPQAVEAHRHPKPTVKPPLQVPKQPITTATAATLPDTQRTHQSEDSQAPPAERTTAPQSAQAPPDLNTSAPAPGAADSVPSDAPLTWQSLVLSYLQKEKRYPAQSRWRHEEGVVYVRFSLDRKGRVLKAAIEHSSGYPALDAEVLDLLQRAQPLPKPPDAVPGDPLELMVPVNFFIRKH